MTTCCMQRLRFLRCSHHGQVQMPNNSVVTASLSQNKNNINPARYSSRAFQLPPNSQLPNHHHDHAHCARHQGHETAPPGRERPRRRSPGRFGPAQGTKDCERRRRPHQQVKPVVAVEKRAPGFHGPLTLTPAAHSHYCNNS